MLGSTDAASVFSVLRSQKLSLKYNTDSLLEVESGSNDPFAYMLMVIILSAMQNGSGGNLPLQIFSTALDVYKRQPIIIQTLLAPPVSNVI